jgi:PERQ amino acid-rich with GYF domain-containing protein
MNASLATPGSRSSGANETRFSKEQMLELYKNSLESRSMNGDIQAILTEGWQPGATSNASNGSWSRKDENKDHIAGPDVCWELGGVIDPLSLKSMTEEEKEARPL